MENAPQPQTQPMNALFIGQQARQPQVLAKRNDIIKLIYEISRPIAQESRHLFIESHTLN